MSARRALNTLLAHEGYHAPKQMFDGRPTHVMQLVDESAQIRHLLYSRLNSVAAGLVLTPPIRCPWTPCDGR